MLKTITIKKKKNSIAQFYQKKEDCNLILTNESKFMNPCFWDRVHEHIISSTTLDSSNLTNSNKYNICQVKNNNVTSLYSVSRITFVKESRFSYIRPVDGATRLIVYNCSNITSLENIVHRGSKVVVEIPDGCMILFTNHTVHAGVKSYEKHGGQYSSHLRMFAYIVEQGHLQNEDTITRVLNDMECKSSCETCEYLVNENIHYEGHVIRYLKSKCEIDNLPKGKVLYGNLEKVGWVVLKCDYAIKQNSSEQNHLYHLNNKNYKKGDYRWTSIHNTNRQMLYNMNEHQHE